MHCGAGRKTESKIGVTCFLAALVLVALPGLSDNDLAVAAGGDWNRTDDVMAGAVGLHAGKIGGLGLAYKYPVLWWLYAQAAGGIWNTSANKRHNVGFEFQYILRQDTTKRLYLAAGVGYFQHRKRIDSNGNQETFETSKTWNSGFGVGIELLRGERVSVQIEGDFTHESDDGDFIFLPQVGVFLYW